eukprot:Opistho-1_new@97114
MDEHQIAYHQDCERERTCRLVGAGCRSGKQVGHQHDAEKSAALKRSAQQDLLVEESCIRSPWWNPHGFCLQRLGFEDDGACRVNDQLQEQDVHRHQHHRPAQNQRHDRQSDNRQMHRQDEGYGLSQVGKNATSVTHGRHQGREIVAQQHQSRGLAGDVGTASTHRDADVGSLEGGCVVDAVPGHRDHIASFAKSLYQPKLLFGLHTTKHMGVGQARCQCCVIQSVQLWACHGPPVGDQACLSCNGQCCVGMVARDHHDPDTCRSALGDGSRHIRSHRILQCNQSHELELEVVLAAGQLT